VCGIVGACSSDGDAPAQVYSGLISLQHRGQESWGVATAGPEGIVDVSALGLVEWPPQPWLATAASVAIGHVRYSTTGAPQASNAQPLVTRDHARSVAVAHNGNVTNAIHLSQELDARGYRFRSTSDSEVILALLALAPGDAISAVADAVGRLEGAYSVVALLDGALVAFRDPHGFRPLAIGTRTGSVAVSSETCALDVLGYHEQREVVPGELVVAFPRQALRSYRVAAPRPRAFCVFEQIYLARRDSRLNGGRVEATRERLGEQLAREQPAPADVVLPVPSSGTPAARGFAQASGLPFAEMLVRNDYVGRTFIAPDPLMRELAITVKFNVTGELEGVAVAVVDDSIVRGATMRHIVDLLRRRGAAEIHVRIAAPPLIAPCYYGVDIQGADELVAAGSRGSDFAAAFGATSLAYLSVGGLHTALKTSAQGTVCTACMTGEYPTRVEDPRGKLRLHAQRSLAG
jgi:amidophosphoribosyltransferase